jgi:hypothetical protein
MLSQLQNLFSFDSVSEDDFAATVSQLLTFIFPLLFLLVEPSLFMGHVLQYYCVIALCLWKFCDKRLLTGLLLAFTLIYHLCTWQIADNHQWLYLYWVIGLFLKEITKSDHEVSAFQARTLLAVVFTVACFWKIVDGEYINGSFFQFEFIADKRLQGFVDQFLAMDFNQVRVNSFISNQHIMDGLTPVFYKNPLVLSERALLVSKIFSYLTIFFEALIAILFLSDKKSVWADWMMLLFIMFTYSLIPVHGFAAILIILCIAQSKKSMVKYYLGALMLQLFIFT